MSTPGMTPAVPAAAGATEAPALPETARLMSTFIAPIETFTDLRRNTKWFAPFLLMAVFSYVLVGVVASKIGFEQVAQNGEQMRERMSPKTQERMEKMTPEQRASAHSISVAITRGISYTIPLFILLTLLVIAGVLLATCNFGLGAEVPFKSMFAVVTYAHLPGILKALLAAVSIFAGASPDSFVFENPVASNLGSFIDYGSHPTLYVLGTFLDIFSIWILVLTGIGIACVSKIKRGTALGVVFGWYVLYMLVTVGISAAFS